MNETWQIQVLKYDGKPHYVCSAEFIRADESVVELRAMPGSTLVHYTRGWVRSNWQISNFTFWRDRWFNVYTNFNGDGSLREFYCNVSLPPTIEYAMLSFVDLDLDVEIYPDGSHQILDSDEFELHRVKYGYPAWVEAGARRAVSDLIELAKARLGPFSLLQAPTLSHNK